MGKHSNSYVSTQYGVSRTITNERKIERSTGAGPQTPVSAPQLRHIKPLTTKFCIVRHTTQTVYKSFAKKLSTSKGSKPRLWPWNKTTAQRTRQLARRYRGRPSAIPPEKTKEKQK